MSKRMANPTVLIAVIGNVGSEPEALRQALENFGYTVVLKMVGRPRDLTEILEGTFPIDFHYLILSCHGEAGTIVMPKLADSVYYPDEHRANFSAREVKHHLRLSGKIVINTGCTTGCGARCAACSADNTYIAPVDYVEGTATVFFIIHLFYELSKGTPLIESFAKARRTDEEACLFILNE